VSKYFLRRWGPYLTPSRFWAVVAARQLAYWHDKATSFCVYDKRFAQEARLSTVHFRRLKAEMALVDQPLSLFLTQKVIAPEKKYHVVNGQTKPRPTTYVVRLDDPLTPADAHHLAAWLQAAAPQRRAEAVTAVLKAARDCPRGDLLAPHLAPHLAHMPATFRYISVLDVVRLVYGAAIAGQSQVMDEAEALHSHLMDPDYYGKEYFRVKWLNRLKPGPAFLVTYLRSLCFYDETTGELRNEVTFSRPDLAHNLGVTTKTVVNWLDKLANVVPAQAIGPFMTLLEQQRLSTNDVQYCYKMEMLEPLTPKDLAQYKKQTVLLQTTSLEEADGKNDHHEQPDPKAADGKNDHHERVTKEGGKGKNDRHESGQKENLITAKRKNDAGSRKKRAPYKYYKILTQALTDKDLKHLLTAADYYVDWRTEDNRALLPLAQAVSHDDIDHLFDRLQVDKGGPSRERMRGGGLGIHDMVAWYLYAQAQPGLNKPPIHMTVSRVQAGLEPPEEYVCLANLSWELWRCYACLLVMPPAVREQFRLAPSYDLWMRHYGRFHPEALPFAVGRGVSETVNVLLYGEDGDPDVSLEVSGQVSFSLTAASTQYNELQALWQPVLQQLSLSMTKATFNAWLKDTVLLQTEVDDGREGQHWTIRVNNHYGVDWLTNRLNKTVIEPVATAVCGHPVIITYAAGSVDDQ
jgi:hypothetical protein